MYKAWTEKCVFDPLLEVKSTCVRKDQLLGDSTFGCTSCISIVKTFLAIDKVVLKQSISSGEEASHEIHPL